MLSGSKLKELRLERSMSVNQVADHLVHGGFDRESAINAVRNWEKGLFKPKPVAEDVERLAGGLGVEGTELSQWQASYRYAPTSARKARLVTKLIAGRNVQDALDLLKFTHKRAAEMITKVLESAIANADESTADVEKLYICEAWVDDAGRRIGTKTWIAKDRGRAHPIKKAASHINITVAEE